MSPENPDIERLRVRQIFRYLEALNQLRNAPKRQIQEQPWVLWFSDIPGHESVKKGVIGDVQQPEPGPGGEVPAAPDDVVLKVRRPKITQAPTPPGPIKSWLQEGWEQLEGSVEVSPSRNETSPQGETIIVRFEDDPQRPRALDQWTQVRNGWVQNERPAREALKLFEKLYELHGQIEREAERVELVLGDGLLNWRRQEGGVNHPVLLKRLQLEFNPEAPEFTLTETGHPTELYSALFRTMAEVDGRILGRCREELEKGSYHPLGGDDTSGFLRRLVAQLHANGQFVGFDQVQGEQDSPRMGRSPVIFMRNRTLGFATALDALLEDIQKRADFPHSLVNIVGIEAAPPEDTPDSSAPWAGSGNENAEILLSKPANVEQLHIAERLNQYGCVVVQGPPGTGKTHTIANLLGHLLSEGKSVLVTSHTTKALRVLRDKVAEPLQPLCVSVLESDLDSRKQLESSVSKIVERLGSASVERLEDDAKSLRSQRAKILDQLAKARKELLTARSSEYDAIVVAGKAYPPSEAARLVARESKNNWIPAPVSLGQPLPLSFDELTELYRSNISVPSTDQAELDGELPELSTLLRPEEFRALIEDQAKQEKLDRRLYERFWASAPSAYLAVCPNCGAKNRIPKETAKKQVLCGQCKKALPEQSPIGGSVPEANRIEEISDTLARAVEAFSQDEPWRLAAIWAGQAGGSHRVPWDSLLSEIANVCQKVIEAQETILKVGPEVPHDLHSEDGLQVVNEILDHLAAGGSLSWWTNLTRPKWKSVVPRLAVSGKPPRTTEHFKALKTRIEISLARTALRTRWQRQMVPLGAPAADELGAQPESACTTFAEFLTNCLEWNTKHWVPLQEDLAAIGLAWEKLLKAVPPRTGEFAELERLREAARSKLPEVLTSRLATLRWEANEKALNELQRKIQGIPRNGSEVLDVLDKGIRRRDPRKYEAAFERLAEILGRRQSLDRRRSLLKRLGVAAPAWAAAISHRQAPHGTASVPGDAESAWLWRQLNDTLDARAKVSPEELQQNIESLNETLRRTTVELIDSRAWAAQSRRTTLPQRQALMGWEQVIRRIGKGTGKRVVRLEIEARGLMDKCRSAVPVWIMPLTRVVDNFNPASTRFDVVIIDEASQCDVMALIALYMARQVVVVGDHEQVSPDAVGQNVGQVQHLIDEHLTGIPNANLYDGQLSIYDLARQSFGGLISLKEHFRCVSEIIQFSNHLSYSGTIRPLRDSASTSLRPFVLEHRVDGTSTEQKVNSNEALEVASLVAAAVEHPRYVGKSFGVISLLGEEQAREIERLVRHHLSPADFEERRIVCGNAAHFQGDERDVMFLSIVDSPREGPLVLREQPLFKKRFNVAASRAKDQMWVVHSLRPELDLKPSDLRRRLIEYARDPNAIIRLLERHEQRAESEFERLVIRHLVSASYKVTPQWKVGHYRIDLVVIGSDGTKLAVECDGDRFHPQEKLAEDMQRQAVLERLGWRFIRIRGSQFFRDQGRTMKPVFERLKDMGVEPLGHAGEVPPEQTADNELRAALIRRAAELRQQWESNPDVESESPGRREEGQRRRRSRERDDEAAQPELTLNRENAEVESGGDEGWGRNIDDVPQDEIREVLFKLLPTEGKMPRESMLRAAVQPLGFKRLARKIRKRLNHAIADLVKTGQLATDWESVWRIAN